MTRILPKVLWIFAATSTLFATQLNAYCARCERIEKEREIEQTKNPQKAGYYDDQISIHSSNTETLPSTRPAQSEKRVLNPRNNRSLSPQTTANENSSTPLDDSRSLSQAYFDEEPLSFITSAYLAQNQRNQIDSLRQNPLSSSRREDFFEENDVIEQERKTLNQQGINARQNRNGNTDSADQSGYFGGSSSPAISQNHSYSTLYTILKTRLFLETLDGSFTLFIPTNEALSKLPPGTLIELTRPENQEKLAALVSNHVVARKMLRKDFEAYEDQEIKAISGRNLTVHSHDGKLIINGAHILRIEPAGYDGIIYIIDKVLIPE